MPVREKRIGRSVKSALPKLVGAGLSVGIGCVYFAGAQRAIGMGDMAEMVVASYTLGIPHPTGYPIYTWLGKIFLEIPTGGVPFRLTLMSVVCASLTLFILYLIVVELLQNVTKDLFLRCTCGVVAVITLGLFRPFLHFAQVSEVYALNSLLVALFFLLVFRWLRVHSETDLYLSAFVLGLGLGTHMTNIFLAPLLLCLVIARRKQLRAMLVSAALVAAGASQYLYLLVRAQENPAYLHPLARFSEDSDWTGRASAVYNWLWFITGARWRGHYARSFQEVSFKAEDLFHTVFDDYRTVGVVALGLGAAYVIARFRHKLEALVLAWILVFEVAYYLFYQPSGSGMVLPLFSCLSIFAAFGVAAAWELASRAIGSRALRDVVRYGTAAAVAIGVAYGFLSKPPVNYSAQKAPATLVNEMIKRLPQGSVVEGLEWNYEKIVDYFRIVEKRSIPFSQGACTPATLAEGKCFILGTQLKDRYLQEGRPLRLYLYVEDAAPIYQLLPRED